MLRSTHTGRARPGLGDACPAAPARRAHPRPDRDAGRGTPAATVTAIALETVDPSFTPSVSIVVPAYNEAAGIGQP